MKKIILVALAAVGLAACATEDTIVTPKGNAIAFGDAFVDNATKAIIADADDIQEFTVFGNVVATDTENIPVALYGDSGASVTRGTEEENDGNGEAWICNVTRYWTPSCTFNFTAIANGTGSDIVNGIPTKISYEAAANDPKDLIYGVVTAKTDIQSIPTEGVNTNKVVAFTMEHLLSRVKLSFKNDINSADYRFVISNVELKAATSGTYTISEEKWTGTAGTLACNSIAELTYGTTVSGEQLVVPESAVAVEFDYELQLKNGETWSTILSKKDYSINAISSPAKNTSYNIIVTCAAGAKIDFTVDATNGLANYTPSEGGDVTIQ